MKHDQIISEECNHSIRAIHDTMEILRGKWKVSIIACLCFQPMRYSQLMRAIDGISGKMLSRELKELEANGLIEREVLDSSPVAVAYRITEYGTSLEQLTQTIAEWGVNHRARIIENFHSSKTEKNPT